MLINAAPRSYTSNIVADADLNLEGYNVTANAIYSKDNYLLTMLDYGEAFPTDVKEGDKVFAWGEDSTKSYIYTYKQGAWDAGVKPQHMQDYYIADENRTVNFYFLKSSDSIVEVLRGSSKISYDSLRTEGLLFGPDCYLMGEIFVLLQMINSTCDIHAFCLDFSSCESSLESVPLVSSGTAFADNVYNNYNVVIPSKRTSFSYRIHFVSYVPGNGGYFNVYGGYEVDN